MVARLGGYATASRHDPMSYTEKARAASPGSDVYFERRIDPEGILPQDERRRRAQAAKRLHFTRLAMRSAQARRKRER
jgi:hypothetical protein